MFSIYKLFFSDGRQIGVALCELTNDISSWWWRYWPHRS